MALHDCKHYVFARPPLPLAVYHQWDVLMSPSKCPIEPGDIMFSKSLESVRKDVECFFGILKGRFRILKLRIPYHKKEHIDNIFFTCCILHNMLHTFDNNGEMEEKSDWAGGGGLHNAWENDPLTDLSSVGAIASQLKVETEPGDSTRRQQLITSFMFRKGNGDIAWLS